MKNKILTSFILGILIIGLTPLTLAESKFRESYWQCQDGKEFYNEESSCKLSSVWWEYAEESCKKRCNDLPTARTRKCGINTFGVSEQCNANLDSSIIKPLNTTKIDEKYDIIKPLLVESPTKKTSFFGWIKKLFRRN